MTPQPNTQLRPEGVVCPNPDCLASDRIGVHSQRERRFICHTCGKTFAATTGTPLFALKRPLDLVVLVLTLMAYGCPLGAIVAAFGLDERTVAAWQHKAGQHAQAVQQHVFEPLVLDHAQIQADELCVWAQRGKLWVATAMDVFSRLWLGYAVARKRDTPLVTRVVEQVATFARPSCSLLWLTDGFGAWYTALRKQLRMPGPKGRRGPPPLVVWPKLHYVQAIKLYAGKRVVGVKRVLLLGCGKAAAVLAQATQVESGCFNTAYVERLNATIRTWVPAMTRRTRTPAREQTHLEQVLAWAQAVYNLCHEHATLGGSPAMAAGLTDHCWSIQELLTFRPPRK